MTSLSPYLSDAEVLEIAKPLVQPAAIIRWFAHQGFVVIKKPNGMPLVSRSHFDAHLSPQPVSAATPTADNTPDVAGFLERFRKGVSYGAHGKKADPQSSGARP